jgi:hypothetical protein
LRDSISNAYGYRYYDSVTNAHGHCYCHVHTDSDGYGNSDFNSNADTKPHSDALHGCGSDSTKRNQCDFQQLYRELEQRKRCDRLSVGRFHKQLFHHLRTRECERRKRDQLARDRVRFACDLLLPSASQQWVCYKLQFQRQKCTDVALYACDSESTKRN